ncbi:hypothetical protein HanRHA438_Chr04g0190831 [Helianthus annuus]|nr:hypothetical protein HanRHA438_Chr04g0190831 [Helianthus annuus]
MVSDDTVVQSVTPPMLSRPARAGGLVDETRRNPLQHINIMSDFFDNYWSEKGVFFDDVNVLYEHVKDLRQRFLMDVQRQSLGVDIMAQMDSNDEEIFRLSNEIWG